MRNFTGTDPDDQESSRANRTWWDLDARNYHEEHTNYLQGFYWCPEMLHEKDIRLLGDVRTSHVLEIGCGSAPCSRWLADDGVGFITAFDISANMLQFGREPKIPLVQADAVHMPYASNIFDVAFSAFGAIPFVADTAALMREVARVLKPGGRFVFSVTHPMRWIFPDDPGPEGLTVYTSYFDRSPYVERDNATGKITYVEHHRTLGDRIRELRQAGFILNDLIEPEWPEHLTEEWGQWSPLRGKLFPGTAIFVAELAR
ncbi:class I SAM-dependent methyltransferase [Corynebacterium canis]|uniref:Class I SAM-dependent methyltransferase n=1 Tax=Corynebacterium canis TaxID=679663 RepID=A0A5C5TXH1_9CORY|nr:class I SAM-dependent methyltransferase [Corynebacterium canis]TWT18466.1 class I SAM-dependent methyltransferase [Corynebacterium canis]WJY75123.1 Demethylmenaquinone methyltransferase [Corynebacterium canis]